MRGSRPSPLSGKPTCLGRPAGECRTDHPDFRRGLRAARHPIGPQNPGGSRGHPHSSAAAHHHHTSSHGFAALPQWSTVPLALRVPESSGARGSTQLGDVDHPRAYGRTRVRLPRARCDPATNEQTPAQRPNPARSPSLTHLRLSPEPRLCHLIPQPGRLLDYEHLHSCLDLRDRMPAKRWHAAERATTSAETSDWCRCTTSAAVGRYWLVAALPLKEPPQICTKLADKPRCS